MMQNKLKTKVQPIPGLNVFLGLKRLAGIKSAALRSLVKNEQLKSAGAKNLV